jgi:hypothetical protein
LELSQEAQAISRSLDNPWSESFTLFTPCFVHWYRLEIPQALEAMRRCIALAREVGFVGGMVTMSNYQAQILLELGQVDEAQKVMQGIRETAERNIPLFLSGASAADASIAMGKGDFEKATTLLRPFMSDNPPFDLMNSFTLENAIGEHLRLKGEFNRLKHFAGKMVSFLKERQLITFLPQFLYLLALASHPLGEVDAAWDALQEALAICDKTGIRWRKWQILALQAEIAEARHEDETAVLLRSQADAIKEWTGRQAGL